MNSQVCSVAMGAIRCNFPRFSHVQTKCDVVTSRPRARRMPQEDCSPDIYFGYCLTLIRLNLESVVFAASNCVINFPYI